MSAEIKTYIINGHSVVPEDEEEWLSLLSFLEESGIAHTSLTKDLELTKPDVYTLFDRNADGLISDADFDLADGNSTQFGQIKDILKKYGIHVEENEADLSSQTAVENTLQTFNEIFKLAGLDSLRLIERPENVSTISLSKNGSLDFDVIKHGGLWNKTDLQGLMYKFGQHLNTSYCQHCSNDEKFFYYIDPKWVLVHFEDENEPDRILYLFPDGWKPVTSDLVAEEFGGERFHELANFFFILHHQVPALKDFDEPPVTTKIDGELFVFIEKGLDDFILDASAQDFVGHVYAFELKEDSDSPSFISPFHQITLAGHPDIVIPWSDPYLLMEWESFLKKAGFLVIETENGTKKYFFKSLLVMESTRTDGEIKFTLFNPAGEIEQETAVKIPDKPEVKVTVPDEPDKPFHSISVYGRELEVEAYFEVDAYFSDYSWPEIRAHYLTIIGKALQEIPESMLAPILDGVKEEGPLALRLSDKEKALEKGWLPGIGGNYSPSANAAWFLSPPHRRTVFHEVGGHALDDFSIPFSPHYGSHLTNPSSSDLRDYYAWKLVQVFSPEELAAYKDLSRYGNSLLFLNAEERRDLKLLREKADTRFVSAYAAEGSEGIKKHLRKPLEDFAEVMTTFFECLTGTKDWESYRSREPLLSLVGLYYLFHEYDVAVIGDVTKEKTFSKEAFREVLDLDIELDDSVRREYSETGLPFPH